MFLKYIVREYNPSMRSFNVVTVERSYMFRLLQSNHHQAAYQKCKEKEIILHVVSGRFYILHVVCLFVCLFPWASAVSHGCIAACWLILPPALDVPTLATRCPRAYRRVPHSSGGSWNLWAGIRTDNFA
jgi:hypothetical protein